MFKQQPAGDVDLKPDGAAEFVDRAGVERDVGKDRSAVERVKLFAANARRVDDVSPEQVDGGSHPRMNRHDRTDRVRRHVGQILGDARFESPPRTLDPFH